MLTVAADCLDAPPADWKEGKKTSGNPDPTDVLAIEQQFTGAENIGAMLFVWTILPAFAASTYIPSLVLERTVFYRSASHPTCP